MYIQWLGKLQGDGNINNNKIMEKFDWIWDEMFDYISYIFWSMCDRNTGVVIFQILQRPY